MENLNPWNLELESRGPNLYYFHTFIPTGTREGICHECGLDVGFASGPLTVLFVFPSLGLLRLGTPILFLFCFYFIFTRSGEWSTVGRCDSTKLSRVPV